MSKTDELRERAKKELLKADKKGYMPKDTSELIYELQIHQVELQMQNKELKESHDEISRLYDQYYELYDHAPVGYFSLNRDGIIRNVNLKGIELLKLSKKDIIGRGFSRFMQKDFENEYYRSLANAINTHENQSVELKLKRNDLSFDVHMDIMPIYERFNECYRITITDITERKKLEKQLMETIDQLKSSNDELQQFAYVSSHDLQEPLRTITSFTQLLERRYKGKLDSDADEFVEYIVDATVHMKQQIQDLLEYSRVKANKEEFKLIDTNNILNKALLNLHYSIKNAKAEITHDKLPNVIGNADQLQRVFQNLISNAIKFRKSEEPLKIHISSYRAEYWEEYVFSVKDNGIGIEEQYFERIFTIFQRLHTREEYHGTGIGLSIIKKIIERHNGYIWVESELGAGSTFYFTIPFKPSEIRGGHFFKKVIKIISFRQVGVCFNLVN
jgi:PAS domain S-box-containing protein